MSRRPTIPNRSRHHVAQADNRNLRRRAPDHCTARFHVLRLLQLSVVFHVAHLQAFKPMNKLLVVAALLAAPITASAANYATCLLDKLPGVQNNQSTYAAARICRETYPERFSGVDWGSGLGLFAAYNSPDECFQENAKSVQDGLAINWIRQSCRKLYSEPPKQARAPDLFDEFGLKPYDGPILKPYDGPYTPVKP